MNYDPTDPQPQWAPGAADHLEELITKESRVFEWGSGQSTAWLARRAGLVVTVESDPGWLSCVHELTKGMDNVHVISATGRERRYLTAITAFGGEWDVVVVDGVIRDDCLTIAWALEPTPILVLDDAMDYIPRPPNGKTAVYSEPHPYAGTLAKDGRPHPDEKQTWIVEPW